MTFLDQLVTKGLINRYQIDDIVQKANQKNGDIDAVLVEMGIPIETILEIKSEAFGVPARYLGGKTISYDVLKYLPEDSARTYQVAPIGFRDGTVEVGMIDPQDIEARNALQFIFSENNVPFTIFVITRADLESIFENYTGISGGIEDGAALAADLDGEADDISDADMQQLRELQEGKMPEGSKRGAEGRIVEDAPVTKMVAVILRHAVEGRASDVHIEHIGEKVKVRYRVDGILHTSLLLPKNVHAAIIARVKILAKLKLDEKRKPQDGRFPAKINGRKVDFRVSTLPTFHGEKVVIRILDQEKGVKGLNETGMRQEHIDIVRKALKMPHGLILLTGPTGSGKTTTLYAMVNEIDREGRNVVSLEDPIEYNIEGLNQSQVRPEIGYTFANGLRSILRQDPDVIMVGEIRDKETAELAIQAALTGHLVFSTLHTNDSIGVVPRLVDMGIDPYLIAPTLRLSIAQRLVKKLCDDGGEAVPIEGGIKEIITRQFSDLPQGARDKLDLQGPVHESKVTDACPGGTYGRMGVFEMYTIDDDVERVILENPTEPAIEKVVREKGMIFMKEDAILKSIEGSVPWGEVNTL